MSASPVFHVAQCRFAGHNRCCEVTSNLPSRSVVGLGLKLSPKQRRIYGINHYSLSHQRQLINPVASYQSEPPPRPPPTPPETNDLNMVSISVVFYSAMTLAGIKLGSATNVGGQLFDAAYAFDVQGMLASLTPLLLFFVSTVYLADKVPAFAELKKLFEEKLVPWLRKIPNWGLFILALSAGIGEETFFRGWLQTTLIQYSSIPGLSEQAATIAGICATATIFGLLHALTPLYFVFATFAGVVFGIEYVLFGLKAAAATHAIYDFVALVSVVELWGSSSDKTKT